jgi:pyruvate/2-oxoglutarate/acetoin dehydrogenase E1 component
MTMLRTRQAVIQALADELESDPRVILIGEDIAAAGGAFKATEGLHAKFGGNRVMDTPISETALLGAAVGAAATGLRPVAELMFIEFAGVALDQITTQAALMRYLSRGEIQIPLTVRAAVGAGLGFGCQHSQMLENWFRGSSGLTVVAPSGPRTAYGLLRSAIRSNDPVVFLEHKALYGLREEVPVGEEGLLPLGRAETVRSGKDVTIVGLAATVHTALAAAEASGDRWDAEVIDLLTISPWDKDAVVSSVAKTKRLVVIEEGPHTGGWSAEISDHVASELWGDLLAPPLRITAPDAPVPYAEALEKRYLPHPEYVAAQVSELIETNKRPAAWWEKTGVMA